MCLDSENSWIEFRNPKSSTVGAIDPDLPVGSPVCEHPEFIAGVFRAAPDIAADRAQEDFTIVGDAAREYFVLKLLNRCVRKRISSDYFVLGKGWLRSCTQR
jgi:hypothetical protein